MRTELISTLLKAGVVTDSQVERAISYHFGSSVLERLLSLGYGSEDDAYKVIKNKLKLEVIEGEELNNIPADVLASVPHDLIEKHHFLPFYADNAKIHVATFDPTQDSCLHEVSFFTSRKIVPFGVRASVLAKALNKYFALNVPEEFRYGKEQVVNPDLAPPPLVEQANNNAAIRPPLPPRPTMMPSSSAVTEPKPPLPPLPEANPLEQQRKLLEQEVEQLKNKVLEQEIEQLKTKVTELAKVKEEPVVVEPVKVVEQVIQEVQESKSEPLIDTASFSIDDDEVSFNDFKDVNVFDNMENAVTNIEPKVEPVTEVIATSAEVKNSPTVEEVGSAPDPITTAQDKDDIINSVIAELTKIAQRAIVFFVKYEDLIAVSGFGKDIDGNLADFKISLEAPSFFKDVYDTGRRFYGITPKNNVTDEFFAHFGGAMPALVCVVPVSIENDVFALIYAEEVDNPMQAEDIAERMAVAFDKLLS